MNSNIKGQVEDIIQRVLSEYGINIAFLVIGVVLGWYLKFFLADRRYSSLVKEFLKEKDERIASLNVIVSDRLNKIVVKEEDKTFFSKIKRHFKKGGIIK